MSQVFPDLLDATTKIKGTTWAEEMNLRDPVDEENETEGPACDEVCLVEVGARTEQEVSSRLTILNDASFAMPLRYRR